MACDPQELRHVPLFALLDDDELAVLAAQVDLKKFAPRQRIYKIGDPGSQAYILMSGHVQVTTVDEDQMEVLVDEPAHGEFFGFASMLEQTPHQTSALATEPTECIEVSRTTSPCCCNASRWRGWICLRCWGASSMLRSIWCGCARTEMRTM